MADCDLNSSWQDFIKILAVNLDLTRTQIQVLVARFPTPIEADFYKISHESVAEQIFPRKEDPCGSLRGHLHNIYPKFGCGSKDIDDSNQKARLVFVQLKEKFDAEQEQKRTLVNLPAGKIQQLNDFLLDLNYSEEENKFDRAVENLDRSGVFLAEIRGSYTQRWLTNRLMVKNPVLKGSCSLGIEANRNWRNNIDLFWQWLAKVDTYDRSQQEATLKKFVGLIQTQEQHNSVLITIYNIDTLRMDDINQILQEFWIPFQAMMKQKSRWETKECILLLIGNPGWVKKIEPSLSSAKFSWITLPVWGCLTEKHMCGWLRGSGVLSFCEQHSEKSRQDIFSFLDIQPNNPSVDRSMGEAEEVLQNICALLNLPNGIAELEQYWKLRS
jgi:inactive STAND